ncbi:hypothetical protein OG21DRAFT_371016 [Imleria badia]|nr:hypothetical protein OG21DRAFT_371016 [Imleria badia]
MGTCSNLRHFNVTYTLHRNHLTPLLFFYRACLYPCYVSIHNTSFSFPTNSSYIEEQRLKNTCHSFLYSHPLQSSPNASYLLHTHCYLASISCHSRVLPPCFPHLSPDDALTIRRALHYHLFPCWTIRS